MKRRVLLAVTAAVAVIAAVLCSPRLVGTVLTPLQTAAATAAHWVGERLGGEWKTRYEEAQAALTRQRTAQAELETLRRRNAWYHEFLGLKAAKNDLSLAEAQVIATDPADPTGGFTVNVGSLDGIAAGMPVITQDGLLGVVHTVGLNWATVRTLYHPEMHVSVTVSRTGEAAQTAGGTASAARLTLTTLPRSSEAATGDLLVTSGLGGAFPAGLLVGEICTVTRSPDGISDIATATTFAAPLPDQVMLVTDFTGKLH